MEQSESVKNIIPALINVQKSITNVAKNADNPFFKSKYADLPSIIEHSRDLLSDNDLVVVQTNEPHDIGIVVVTTMYHSSGEWIRGKLRLTPSKNDPQQAGSAITYGRRYTLAAILNIAQEDDDGNLASGKKHERMDNTVEPRLDYINKAYHVYKEEVENELYEETGDFKRMQQVNHYLTNDERIAVENLFGKETVPNSKKMLKTIVRELLSKTEADNG